MTRSGQPFGPHSSQDLVRLVRENPLAWIVSGAGETFAASLLPLLPKLAGDGRLIALAGHFPRAHPQVARLKADAQASILFLGPNGYVSPSWMEDRTQAPTWNYASAQFLVEIEFVDDGAELEAHLQELVDAMETSRPGRWKIEEMGERYRALSRRIIAFVAHVREVREKYKLGQDERDDVFGDILTGVEAGGDAVLLEWMRHFNAGRRSGD
jgi:transcriptional regulator